MMKIGLLFFVALIAASCTRVQSENISIACPRQSLEHAPILIQDSEIRISHDLSLEGELVDIDGWSVFVASVIEPTRGLPQRSVLYVPGGPRIAPITASNINTLKQLYDDGNTQVLMIAHSGNDTHLIKGSERIRKHGMRSVSCDQTVLTRYLREKPSNNQPEKFVVHGVSYGSLLALLLGADADFDPELIVIQAPWIYPASIEDMLNSDAPLFVSQNGRIELSRRDKFEVAMNELYADYLNISPDADGTSLGEKYMQAVRSNICERVTSKLMLLIAEREDRSDVEKTLSYIECFENEAHAIVSKGAVHGSELAVRSTREHLQMVLQELDD